MTLCHAHRKKDPFVRFDKRIVYDNSLSWKATGILAYAFSRPEDWTFYKSEMIKHKTDGEASFDSGIKELEFTGYLHRFRRQNSDTGQMEGWEWHFFEVPISDEEFKKSYRQGGFTVIGKKPISVKSLPTKKDSLSKKEETNKPEAKASALPPSSESVCSFKDKILGKTKLTSRQAVKIRKDFEHLDDKIFEGAIKAFLAYAKENNVDDYIATLISSLGGKKGTPWVYKPSGEDRTEENKKLVEGSLGRYDCRTIGKSVQWQVSILRKYIEFSCGMQSHIFEYSRVDFKQAVNEFLQKSRVEIRV